MNKKKLNTRSLVQGSFLVAISIVMTRFLYFFVPLAGLPTIRISFGEMPLMLSGLLFGPFVGGISGLAADLIGVAINPQAAFHPGFVLSSILWGVIPGLLGNYFKLKSKDKNPFTIKRIYLTVIVAYVIISLGLNTVWLTGLYGKGFMVLFPGRVIAAMFNIPLQSFVINLLIKHLRRMVLA